MFHSDLLWVILKFPLCVSNLIICQSRLWVIKSFQLSSKDKINGILPAGSEQDGLPVSENNQEKFNSILKLLNLLKSKVQWKGTGTGADINIL